MRPTQALLLALPLTLASLAGAAEPLRPETLEGARVLAKAGLASQAAWQDLTDLCDRAPHRLCGSEGYGRAVAWALEAMRGAGLEKVHCEPVKVPHWVRNRESARLLAPMPVELSMLGLGMSVATPVGGLEAEVVVVGSLAELAALPRARVEGRIVLFDFPFTGYGAGARIRFAGASAAARQGAVAMLMASITNLSYDTPHTGTLHYDDGVPRIPAAALSVENARMLRRLAERGERVRVHLEMACQTLPDVEVATVVGELPGRTDELVLVGGHLDAWDVGQGAQDDGVGCVLALQSARLIKQAGLRPRRTVRVVFFANEENGARGADAYRDQHRAELPRHMAVVEADSGNGPAKGFSLDLPQVPEPARAAALARLQRLAPLLEPLGAARLVLGGSGVDIEPTVEAGVPGLGLSQDTSRYWEVHHSRADTLEHVDRADLARNGAVLAVMVYGLAELPERLLP